MNSKHIITAAIATLGSLAAGGVAQARTLPLCNDSNGSAPGGTVYATEGQPLGCDVRPPQQLAERLTAEPRTERQADWVCDQAGGRGVTRITGTNFWICWDRDY